VSANGAAVARGTPALRAISLTAGYRNGHRASRVLHGLELAVAAGKTVGVVGESGSGKTTLARVLVGQLRPATGRVVLGDTDLAGLRGNRLRAARRRIQLIPQDPYASLDPRMTVGRALEEAISPAGGRDETRSARVAELLHSVALDADVVDSYPHEFSGGQRQRIAIARALAVKPEVIVADEITSSLDSSVQAEILNLLRDIQTATGVAIVFITHDLSVANYMCDELYVLYLGRIVEKGPTRLLFAADHPYTRLLVDSIPRADLLSAASAEAPNSDDAPDPTQPPPGCPFHPRCPNGPRRHPERRICGSERPLLAIRPLVGVADATHTTACHFPLNQARDQPAEGARRDAAY
jgi:peptide/nickel transport system ATP-binding protein